MYVFWAVGKEQSLYHFLFVDHIVLILLGS
jgi:hypothetical protein